MMYSNYVMTEGFLLIDKPAGLTSHDVVDAIRKLTGVQRVGHAGTLDPFATGLLIVAVGRSATKQLGAITSNTLKTYEATLRLGATSETGDPEGPITEQEDVQPPTKSAVQSVINSLKGSLQQQPPDFSAIKVQGVPAYKLKRAGQSFDLPRRTVQIESIHLRGYHWPEVQIEVTCSAGTYIRSLAQTIGDKLNCGAYLTALRRTAIGQWSVTEAVALDSLLKSNPVSLLRPIEQMTQ